MRELRWLLTHVPVIGCKSHKFPTFAQHLPIASMGSTSRPFATLAPDFNIPFDDSTSQVIPLLAKPVSQARYIPIPSGDSIFPPILEIDSTSLQIRHWFIISPIPVIGKTFRPYSLFAQQPIYSRRCPNVSLISATDSTSHKYYH